MQSELLQEIERSAAHGKPCPKDLKPPETMLYYMLSGLYARYQAGKLSKTEATKRKQSILNLYERSKADYEQYIAVCAEYQRRIREGYSVSGQTIIKQEDKK